MILNIINYYYYYFKYWKVRKSTRTDPYLSRVIFERYHVVQTVRQLSITHDIVGEFLLVPFTLPYLVICLLFSLEGTSPVSFATLTPTCLLLALSRFPRQSPSSSSLPNGRSLASRLSDTAIDTNGNVFLRPARASWHVRTRIHRVETIIVTFDVDNVAGSNTVARCSYQRGRICHSVATRTWKHFSIGDRGDWDSRWRKGIFQAWTPIGKLNDHKSPQQFIPFVNLLRWNDARWERLAQNCNIPSVLSIVK